MRTQVFEPRPIAAVSTSVTAFAGRTRRGPLHRPVQVNSIAEFDAAFGGLWNESPLSFAVQHFFENGGHVAVVARVASGDATESTPGSPIGDADLVPGDGIPGRRGLSLLESQANFDLLVIPPFAWDRDPGPATWASAAEYCRSRRAFLLIDPPVGSASGWTGAGEIAFSELLHALPQASPPAANAAYYLPRLIARNALTQQTQSFSPAGALAGVVARTDTMAGVWSPPAGNDVTILGTSGLERNLTAQEIADVVPLGINCLRALPSANAVVWGARTLQGADALASEWKYIPIRRFALFLEKSIDQGTRWARFEENDEPVWARIRLDISEFMHALFLRGAFQGSSPADAYFVRCGADTTTQQDIEQGVVNIQVGIAPIRPAEFVIISIRQLAGQTLD